MSGDARSRLTARLAEALTRAAQGIARLEAQMGETTLALGQARAESLESSLQQELAVLGELQALFQGQQGALREQGFASDRQGFEQAVAWCADDRVRTLWQDLREALARCREHNRSNARIAHRVSAGAGTALRILRGGGEADAYGPRGEIRGSTTGHTLARA